MIVIFFGPLSFIPSTHQLVALIVGFLSFAVGVLTIPDVPQWRFFTVATAFCAWLIGYFASRNINNSESLACLLLSIGLIYSVVCTIALLKIFPSIFHITNYVGYKYGSLVIRPEITTDQNFQIFYLFPLLLPLILPFRLLRGTLTIIGAILAIFVLAQIKTRSGFLVFLGITALCFSAPLFTKNIGRKKIIVLPILLCLLFIANIPFILEHGAGLIDRLTNDEYSSLRGRIYSFLYIFDKLLDFNYWIPHGNAEFLKKTGSLPHSNSTAVFLEGGILGLYMWISLILIPTCVIFYHFLRRRLSDYQTMLMAGAIASFVIQLSLNAPLHEHVWLWSGILCGILQTIQFQSIPKRRSNINCIINQNKTLGSYV